MSSQRDLEVYADNLRMAQQIRGLKLISWFLLVIVMLESWYIILT